MKSRSIAESFLLFGLATSPIIVLLSHCSCFRPDKLLVVQVAVLHKRLAGARRGELAFLLRREVRAFRSDQNKRKGNKLPLGGPAAGRKSSRARQRKKISFFSLSCARKRLAQRHTPSFMARLEATAQSMCPSAGCQRTGQSPRAGRALAQRPIPADRRLTIQKPAAGARVCGGTRVH
jgi:hypothetical protein